MFRVFGNTFQFVEWLALLMMAGCFFFYLSNHETVSNVFNAFTTTDVNVTHLCRILSVCVAYTNSMPVLIIYFNE